METIYNLNHNSTALQVYVIWLEVGYLKRLILLSWSSRPQRGYLFSLSFFFFFLVFLIGCCLRVSNKLTVGTSPELALSFILVITVCSFISRDLNRAQPVSSCISCAFQSLTFMSCAVLPSACLFLC